MGAALVWISLVGCASGVHEDLALETVDEWGAVLRFKAVPGLALPGAPTTAYADRLAAVGWDPDATVQTAWTVEVAGRTTQFSNVTRVGDLATAGPGHAFIAHGDQPVVISAHVQLDGFPATFDVETRFTTRIGQLATFEPVLVWNDSWTLSTFPDRWALLSDKGTAVCSPDAECPTPYFTGEELLLPKGEDGPTNLPWAYYYKNDRIDVTCFGDVTIGNLRSKLRDLIAAGYGDFADDDGALADDRLCGTREQAPHWATFMVRDPGHLLAVYYRFDTLWREEGVIDFFGLASVGY